MGSKSLLERHDLGVSAATVRHDMSSLEEDGLIAQPHTSAGRVPTDKGYRAFIDQVASIKPLSAPERRAIESFLAQAEDLDDLLERTVRLLARLTHQVALVQHPARAQATVRHIELVRMGESMLLLVLITQSGRVDQRTITLADAREPAFYEQLRSRLNTDLAGREVDVLAASLEAIEQSSPREDRAAVREVLDALAAMLAERREKRLVMAGAANLARSGTADAAELGPMLDVLEEQLVLLRLLGDMSPPKGAVEVRIGEEIVGAELRRSALVGAGYGEGSHLAVLGPSRMDYVTSIASVQAIARYVSRVIR